MGSRGPAGMPITKELVALGTASRRLNDGSDELNKLIARIDELLKRMTIGLEYYLPQPLAENVVYDRDGKRCIELVFLGYARSGRSNTLVLRTTKVAESKVAAATETPGEVIPLMQAPRRLRHRAVDQLPALVTGLSAHVEEVAATMRRRCEIAASLVARLEGSLGGPREAPVPTADPATPVRTGRTVPCLAEVQAPRLASDPMDLRTAGPRR